MLPPISIFTPNLFHNLVFTQFMKYKIISWINQNKIFIISILTFLFFFLLGVTILWFLRRRLTYEVLEVKTRKAFFFKSK